MRVNDIYHTAEVRTISDVRARQPGTPKSQTTAQGTWMVIAVFVVRRDSV